MEDEVNEMKIQLASDLHLEINTRLSFDELLEPIAPILILAGDIGNPTDDIYAEFLLWCGSKYETVFVIAGNHEYYSLSTIVNMKDRKALILSICDSAGNNIHFLDNSSCQINDDVVIIGSTLWSYISPKNALVVSYCINDFRYIYTDDDALLSINEYNGMHIECYRWLEEEIDKHSDKTVLVVTHHLPSFSLIANKYKGSAVNSAFASDVDHFYAKDNVKYWFYGHSHASSDVIKEGCRLATNPHGYGDENEKYRKNMSIKL